MTMSIGELTAEPQLGDTAFYRSSAPDSRKQRVEVTGLFLNGRIKATFPDGSWKSLPRTYHKRVQNERHGLVRIE
jgi:hypothetical protein